MNASEFLVIAERDRTTLVNLSQVKTVRISGQTIYLNLGEGVEHTVSGEDAKAFLGVLAERVMLPSGSPGKSYLLSMAESVERAIAKKKREDAEAAERRDDQRH